MESIFSLILFIAIFLIILAIDAFIKNFIIKTKGDWGEYRVAKELSSLPADKYRVINNILLNSGMHTTQIDHIVISVYGIFVIETKHIKGWISGNENSKNWTQNIFGHKYSFYNPIKQNKSHVLALQKILSLPNDKFIPIVVFTSDCNLRVNTESNIIYLNELNKNIYGYTDIKLTLSQIGLITSILTALNEDAPEIRKKHISAVKRKTLESKRIERYDLCPRCGNQLVLREGKYGKFWGCKSYPACRFTRPYSDEGF